MSYQYRPRRMDKIKRLTTRNVIESVLMRWMNLESIIQSEVNQKEKNKYHILMHIYRIEKNGTEEFICRAAMEKQT